MVTNRSRGAAMVLGLALGLGGLPSGCDRPAPGGGTAARISPEMKKKADENLKGYAGRAAARAQARRPKTP